MECLPSGATRCSAWSAKSANFGREQGGAELPTIH